MFSFTLTLKFPLTFPLTSHRIHEGALDFVEDDDAEEQQDAHKYEGVAEGEPGEVTLAEGDVFEGLDDRGHRVEHDDGAQCRVCDHAHGVDNGGGVHPELDDEGEEDSEVTVLSGHRGDKDAKA